jgi:hypothetical protein
MLVPLTVVVMVALNAFYVTAMQGWASRRLSPRRVSNRVPAASAK